jgi:hypothetical protein
MRLNKIAFKYLDLEKNVDSNVRVKVFNFIMKANAKTFKIYIINVFNGNDVV